MTEENKYCGEIMKKGFKKLLKWPREIIKALKKPVDGGFCGISYADGYVSIRAYCYVTRKYRCSHHKNRYFYHKIIQKMCCTFHNLKIMIHLLLCKNLKSFVLK